MIRRQNEVDIVQISSAQTIISLAQAIKELVENSIDSKATRIEIKTTENGKSIQIIDDGTGINPENHSLICLRNYTEKIDSFGDIDTSSLFGFRGEALSSLCAMSELTIITCPMNETCGYKLNYDRMGKLTNTSRIARSKGIFE